ncbi:MAG: isocitrate/isopropylmalate family dehydrogenase [Miltoncostaeaceae bacterium]
MSRRHRVTLIPGDGIGPEVIEATRRTVEATGASIEWDVRHVGQPAIDAVGTPLPDDVPSSIVDNGIALKGPVSTPAISGFRSVNIALRVASGLFANVRAARSFPGVPTPFEDVDVVVIRDVTEDCYATGAEMSAGTDEADRVIALAREVAPGAAIPDGAAITLKAISPQASRRVAEYAFEFARRRGRRKVTAVHKAAVMKSTDGLFLEIAREVAAANPDIEFEDRAVDIAAAHLVTRPHEFDVLLTPMQYGDILSDLCGGLVGGPGMIPGFNVGTEAVLFEPGHGSAPPLADRDVANPFATMLSAVEMLHQLDESDAAARIERAIAAVIADGRRVSYDLRPGRERAGAAGTGAVADAVIERLGP